MEKCSICGSENWHDLDKMRDLEYWLDREYIDVDAIIGFRICQYCGYVNYQYRPEGALKDHYTTDRNVVSFNNVITSNRKNCYHHQFLKDVVNPDMTILDIGCAQGGWLEDCFQRYGVPTDNLYGTEWGRALVSFAKHYYGLNVDYEIQPEWPKKYDLISCYHVLEHMQAPELELEKMRDLLTDDGYIYLSVPIWFDVLDETSLQMVESFEHHYHLNHINVFSEKSFNNLLKRTGFKIVKLDTLMYGYTVLLQKCEKSDEIERENYLEIIDIMERQQKAIKLFYEKKHEEALEMYPAFPDCWVFWSMDKVNLKEFKLGRSVLERGLEACPNSLKIKSQLAKLYFQWDENTPDKVGYFGNNIKMSERWFDQILTERNDFEECYYFKSLIEAKYKRDYRKAIDYMQRVLDNNPTKFQESINYIAKFCDSLEKEAAK